MIKQILIFTLPIFFISACATNQLAGRCTGYTISGDNVDWQPIKFYQSESSLNQLYIELPKSTNYTPVIEVIDTEFDQPYKINYSYDNQTNRYKVEDNHDMYLMYRETSDGLHKDKVYIACNRNVKN